MTIDELITKVKDHLDGIDRISDDGGYWQTPDGAKVGRIILRGLEKILRDNWPNPAAPPADGEVAELVEWLNSTGELAGSADIEEAKRYWRAAELLQQRHPAPVAVSERLPDASDPGECRMPDGDCWWFDPHADGAWYFDTYQGNYTHWLPAHDLPLSAGEPQP